MQLIQSIDSPRYEPIETPNTYRLATVSLLQKPRRCNALIMVNMRSELAINNMQMPVITVTAAKMSSATKIPEKTFNSKLESFKPGEASKELPINQKRSTPIAAPIQGATL